MALFCSSRTPFLGGSKELPHFLGRKVDAVDQADMTRLSIFARALSQVRDDAVVAVVLVVRAKFQDDLHVEVGALLIQVRDGQVVAAFAVFRDGLLDLGGDSQPSSEEQLKVEVVGDLHGKTQVVLGA